MTRWAPVAGAILILLSAQAAQAESSSFPGVSRYTYFSEITWHLRNPMLDDGKLIGESVTYRDNSVFSDASYADLLPLVGLDDGQASMGTAGLTLGEPELFTYLVVGGVWGYQDDASRYGRGIWGVGVHEELGAGFVLDAYAQAELDTDTGFDWEFGVSPFESLYFSPELRAHFHLASLAILESWNSLPFVQFSARQDLEQEITRYQLSTSRRDIFYTLESIHENSWDIELVGAVTQVSERIEGTQRRQAEDIGEVQLKLYASTVGGGPPGEPRPGLHVHLSYVAPNSSGFEGWGGELGFGAGQFDTRRSQELFFTLFYNYSGYFYRSPSLQWGGGLVGRF